MKTFSDGTNAWSLEINVGAIKRVLATTGINLSLPHAPDADGNTLADRLNRDTILQVDVIWALLEPQARTIITLTGDELTKVVDGETVKLTADEQLAARIQKFCELMKPEVMKIAEAALLEEWTDFFRKLGREPIAKAIEQTQALQGTMEEEGIKQLDRLRGAQAIVMRKALTDEVDRVLQMAEDVTSGKTSESAIALADDSASDPAKSMEQPCAS